MKNKKLTAALCALCMTVLLTGCGGGGGSPSLPSGTGTGTTTPDTGTPTAAPVLSVAIYGADGLATNIGLSGSFTARATVKDANGTAVPGRTVTFSLADEAFATLSPSSALTNSAGVAEVSIRPASITASGAATLTAKATVDATEITGTTDFSISAPNLSLSPITASSSTLASGDNSTLTVSTLINGQALTAQPANVAFSATCGRINGIDTSTTVATNGSGIAAVTYSAITGGGGLCSGPVTVTATTAGAASVGTSLTVAAPTATAVTFVGASNSQIYVTGAGNAEQSILSYKVLSSANTALANQVVNFALLQNPAGVTLNQASGMTDSNGLVIVTVAAGTLPGPVKVRATLAANSAVFAESQNLTVASGPPSQKFMSLSVSQRSLEAANIDGTPTTLIVRIADRQGNAVADGTVVNFTSEGGQVGSSCATTTIDKISSCSVNFVSQNPRPANGRVSVLAYLEGTKDYSDVNGNNRYDAGTDTLVQLGDAYRDDDESLTYDASKDGFLFARNVTDENKVACSKQVNGAVPSRDENCASTLATTVRQQAVILFAASTPAIEIGIKTTAEFKFWLTSDPTESKKPTLLPMPAGTKVAFTTIDNTPANDLTCTLTDFSGTAVADASPTSGKPGEDLKTLHAAFLKDCAPTYFDSNNKQVVGDSVKVSVTAPSGLETSTIYTLDRLPPP